MRVFFSAILCFFSVFAQADEKGEVFNFIESFYMEFNRTSDPKSIAAFFADSPVFFLGEQPAVSKSQDFAPRMVELLRDSMAIKEFPYTGVEIEFAKVSKDGSATAAVIFKRSKSNHKYQKAACNIFSLAKLGGKWKILGWSTHSTVQEDRCTWA
uniref:hypothetical protein n=1 Tax=Microbulbifer agarilyticus TaxID=260552 RepID=UPI000255A4AC|nr:hypothetical protein [Microbulbifer agarilyticus]